MQSVTGEPAALVAATLVQAEMALRGAAAPASKADIVADRFGNHRKTVVDAYEYYLELVRTGSRPTSDDPT